MSRIRAKDTAPERIVRSVLHRLGARFRLHSPEILGSPDIVLRKYRLCIFVHGCFWHRHARCKYAYTPKSRIRFWQRKFKHNVARDRYVRKWLRGAGWQTLVIWECETRNVDRLAEKLRGVLAHSDKIAP